MTRLILVTLLLLLVARVLWQLAGGILAGLSGPDGRRVLRRGGRMVRDPVCGMFILPEGAVTVGTRDHVVHFCSTDCRDKYQRKSA